MISKLSAHYIFTGVEKPLKFGIVVCNANGFIEDIIDTAGTLTEEAGLEFFNGILTPGLINSLEVLDHHWLSHYQPKSQIPINDYRQIIHHLDNYGTGKTSYPDNKSVLQSEVEKPLFNNPKETLEQLTTIQQQFPGVSLQFLIELGSIASATFCGISKTHGSLEKGKQPGILNIDELDLMNLKLTSACKVKRIV